MRGLSIDRLTYVMRVTTNVDPDNMSEKYTELFELFADKLVAWNITDDDDVPTPATKESVMAIADDDPIWMFGLIMTWADAIGSVDIPLPKGSSSGQDSPEPSTLGLASQSKSLGS
jgi:hypothetical protein